MNYLLTGAIAATMLASPAFSATLGNTTGYALSLSGSKLAVFDSLGDTSNVTTLDLMGDRLDAITYRPFTGDVLGYSIGQNGQQDRIYSVNTATGALTDVSASFGPGVSIASGSRIGADFNTNLDAVRIVSTKEDNLVYFPGDTASGNPNAGGVIRATDLFYAGTDANAGANPRVFANAYTNAVDGEVSPTTSQFALDAETNSLVTLANNAGTLGTVGKITVNGTELDFNAVGGFDIVSSSQGDNFALALLNTMGGSSGKSGFYTVDLTTGAASLFAETAQNEYSGFAARVTPGVAAVPLPASAFLLLAGLGGMGALRMRRKSA